MKIGLIGLGRMGGNIARRLMRDGHQTVVYDNNPDARAALAKDGGEAVDSLEAMVKALPSPRAVWVMLPAGEITENKIQTLSGLLGKDDIVIDGGNTFYKDDARRAEELATKGEPAKSTETADDAGTREAMCLMIESAAKSQNLPVEFFARVIWQESRFQANAVGPVTRSGQRAEGIAQFMPGTANERRLLDPFDPVQALPKSAEFLNELRNQFGNLGLAAAAYNAGPRRVQDWLAGTGGMPQETRHYVFAITGSSVDDWAAASNSGKTPDNSGPSARNLGCRELIALLKRAPNPLSRASSSM